MSHLNHNQTARPALPIPGVPVDGDVVVYRDSDSDWVLEPKGSGGGAPPVVGGLKLWFKESGVFRRVGLGVQNGFGRKSLQITD
jgi:hypothetical protein